MIKKLCQEGYRFNFFQAVNVLERLHQSETRKGQAFEEGLSKTGSTVAVVERGDTTHSPSLSLASFAPPGEEGPLSQEAIRFRASPKRDFPPAEIAHIRPAALNRNEVTLIVLTFMGLYGVDSPLPAYFSDVISVLSEADAEEEAVDPKDGENSIRALRGFLDIFGHRIYSLFYRSWKKYRYYLQFKAGARDQFSQYMLSLMGLGTPALQDLVGVEFTRLIAYTGIMGQQARCPEGLQNLLSDYYSGIDAKVIEFMPRWVDVPDQYKTRLGVAGTHLGKSITIGKRIRDFNGKFRVVLGPLKLEAFRGFLPGGTNSQELQRLIRLYAPDQLSFDVELLLRKEEVPPLQLGKRLVQLGWTSWLRNPHENIVSIVFSFDRRRNQ